MAEKKNRNDEKDKDKKKKKEEEESTSSSSSSEDENDPDTGPNSSKVKKDKVFKKHEKIGANLEEKEELEKEDATSVSKKKPSKVKKNKQTESKKEDEDEDGSKKNSSDNPPKGKSETEDSKDKDKKEDLKSPPNPDDSIRLDLGKLLQDLKNLSAIVTKSGTINSSFKVYDVKSFGPKELKVKVKRDFSHLFEIVEIGDDHVPYVVFSMKFPINFKDIEEFIDAIIELFETLLDYTCTIYIEPKKNIINLGEMYDLEQLGLPSEKMANTTISNVDVMNSVFPLARPQPAPGEIFRRNVRVAIPAFMAELLRSFYNLVELNMGFLRQHFINAYTYMLSGGVPPKVPPVLHLMKRLNPITNPYDLNPMFQEIPLGLQFSYGLICELIFPELELTPIRPDAINLASAASVTRSSITNVFNNISINSEWHNAIYAYISSFIVPGFVEISIDFDGLDSETESPTYLLSLLICKLMFMHSNLKEWRNITVDSVNKIDRTILRMLVEKKILNYVGPFPMVYNYQNVVIRPNYVNDLPNFMHLATNNQGTGWMNDGVNRIHANDGGDIFYQFCPPRQSYINDVSTREDKFEDEYQAQIGEWHVFSAMLEICDCLQRRKGEFQGMVAIFQSCGRRVYDFFSELNIYLRTAWYSGFRVPAQYHRNVRQDAVNFRTVNMDLRCVIGLFKSLNGNHVIQRPYDYSIQFKAEAGIAFDTILLCNKLELVRRMFNMIDLPAIEFKNREIFLKCMPKDGPLHDHLKMIDSLRLNAGIGNLGIWAHGSDMSNFLHLIVEAILANDIQFGFIRSYIRIPVLMNTNFDDLMNLAENNVPYFNILDNPGVIMDFDLNAMRNSIMARRLAITLLAFNHIPIRVRIPLPVSLEVRDCLSVQNRPIDCTYKNNLDGLAGPSNMTVRFAIKLNKFNAYICSISRRALELNPDVTVDSLDPFGLYWLERRQTDSMFLPFQDWLNDCAAYFNPIFVNSIEEIEYVSFTDFESQG